ncbi:MAG: gamma-glutamylcyclotransferase family protein [Candidatus Hodarchaeota archaeon]
MKSKNAKEEIYNRLFVYGTLQHGQSRNYILRGLKFDKAILFKYRKVTPPSLGFPFIIRDDSSNVKGEVYYGLDQYLIHQIDMIEGEGELYHRIVVKVNLDNGKEIEAFTYYPSRILIEQFI